MLHYQHINNDIMFTVPYQCEKLYLIGTFTNWEKKEAYKFSNTENWHMLRKNQDAFYKLGNSGYIEYCLWDDENQRTLPFNSNYPAGYYFNNQHNGNFNYLLLPENITPEEIAQIASDSKRSFHIKTSAEAFSSQYILANFREVTGGELASGRLYRSYHPVVASRQNHAQLKEIETERQQVAMTLLEEHGINTVINLSETDRELALALDSAQDSYYKTLWLKEQVVSVPMAYETVYFMSDRDESFNPDELGFQSGIRQVIQYISQHQGPYHVHCRLGSDRTGVVIAFLQLMMGATKEQIRHNYLQTNNMAIGEFRSFRLLEQALTSALGIDCFENSAETVRRYLSELGVPQDIIDTAYGKLAN